MEFVLVMVVLLPLLFGAVQVGLWYYGRSVVVAAANSGAEAASAGDGTDATGRQAAEEALASLGALAGSPSAAVVDQGGEVTVEASADVVSVIPFVPAVPVRAAVVMHRELPAAAGGG